MQNTASADFTLFVVDDAASSRLILESAFATEYRVEFFSNAEDCLARLDGEAAGQAPLSPDPGRAPASPNLFLLDVDLPGMDGFTLCRNIKARDAFKCVPVIFISGLDDAESQLEGYDAGGLDYITKPLNLVQIRRKVRAARHVQTTHESLNAQLADSEALTSLVLSNLDEYAVLVRFLRAVSATASPRQLADALLELLRAYHLHAAVQIRLPKLTLTVGEQGDNSPLEVAVIDHIRDIDRIVEFGRHSAYNFAHVTLLVNNMPRADAELCGRLRDHLAIAAEAADARLQALRLGDENTQARGQLGELLAAFTAALDGFRDKAKVARYQSSLLAHDLVTELTTAFTFLGMSEAQERRILDIVQSKVDALSHVHDRSHDTEATLNDLAERLSDVLTRTLSGRVASQDEAPAVADESKATGVFASNSAAASASNSAANLSPNTSVELF